MARLPFEAVPRALDSNGDPIAYAKMYVYEAGTTTQVDTFSDLAMTTQHTFPIISDAFGIWPEVYVPSGSYKVRLANAAGTKFQEADNVTFGGGGSGEAFDSVAAMKASLTLNDGDFVETRGYYSEGDGGAAKYRIVTAASFGATPDGYGDHSITSTANGSLVAQLIVSFGINAEWYGVITKSPLMEASARWQAAWNACADLAGGDGTDGYKSFFSCHAHFLTKDQLFMAASDAGSGNNMIVDQRGTITVTTGGNLEGEDDTPMMILRLNNSEIEWGLLDCNKECSGIVTEKCGQSNFYDLRVRRFKKFGCIIPAGAGGDPNFYNPDIRQWSPADTAEWATDVSFNGDALVCGITDMKIYGGNIAWCRACVVLLDRTPVTGDVDYPPTEGRNIYLDYESEGTSDLFFHGTHFFQGRGPGSDGTDATPTRYDNIENGGPIGVECWNDTKAAYFLGCDFDALTFQIYGYGIEIQKGSYIVNNGNAPINGRAAILDPRARIYANGKSQSRRPTINFEGGMSVGFFAWEGHSFTGDYSAINLAGRQETGTYTGDLNYRDNWDATTGVFPGGGGVSAGDVWIVGGVAGDPAETVDGQDFSPGDLLCALVNTPSTTTYAANWHVSQLNSSVPERVDSVGVYIRQGTVEIIPRGTDDSPYSAVKKPAGRIEYNWDVAGEAATMSWNGGAVEFAANVVRFTAMEQHRRPAFITITGVDTMTYGMMDNGLINYTGGAAAVTMPPDTGLDQLEMSIDTAFSFWVINTGSGTMTLTMNTGTSMVGLATVAVNTSAQFWVRKAAASTYIVYRMN